MEKILFVDNNLNIGGIQKAFVALLREIEKDYDITLVLFCSHGELLSEIPSGVKVISAHGFCDFLGSTQKQAQQKGVFYVLARGCCAFFSRIFGNSIPVQLVVGRKIRHEGYDYAISFMQFSPESLFLGGTNEYVLNAVQAKTKISFVHCDISEYGGNLRYIKRQYGHFDRVAVCSDSCKKKLLTSMPELRNKAFTVRNCSSYDRIVADADLDAYIYDRDYINVITVARLSEEKELFRGMKAMARCLKEGIRVNYHIVGDGPERNRLQACANELGIAEHIFFHGMQKNPYRFMKNADMFLLPSRHEAAPMVFDEARCLGLPVLTTATCSAYEMVAATHAGWVCENSEEGVADALVEILSNPEMLSEMRRMIKKQNYDNMEAVQQFKAMLKGVHIC